MLNINQLIGFGAGESHLYASWNPSDKSANVTLSNNNLTASGASTTNGVRGTISKSTGKWYWETDVTSVPTNNSGLGVANSSATLTTMNGTDANALIWLNAAGIYFNNVKIDASTFAAGDDIEIAYDAGAGTVQFLKNGTSVYTASGSNVPAGALFPAYFANNTVGNSSVTANFGATSFKYAPPSGFNSGLYS